MQLKAVILVTLYLEAHSKKISSGFVYTESVEGPKEKTDILPGH